MDRHWGRTRPAIKTLIILNPFAASGRAGKLWGEIEPLLWELLGELVVAVTQRPEEVAQHLELAYAAGLTRVISIGGDGTNHALVNALAALNERHPEGPQMVYGNLPVGTGRDWARNLGTPFDIKAAAHWIAQAQPHPTDVGLLTFDGKREHFLNIGSAGMGGEVDRYINGLSQRRPWSFLQATVSTLLRYQPPPIRIALDGQEWYEGTAYIVAVSNGSTFAHGMKIAPNAEINDGLFDVILVKGMSRLRILAALWSVYNGSHLSHPCVQAGRARQVQIDKSALNSTPLGLDLDGEHAEGHSLTFEMRPGLLQLLT
ncbi:MAG: diacylglycerol kinase family lipid kinase [Burkholderiales bacterium]|nr:diacylglycerol kinase family lipid kinase [Anaerolineae bacterium]